MAKYHQETIEKANTYLDSKGKKISVHQNGDETYALYLNGMLIYWRVPEERLLLNIMMVFFANI